MIHQIFLIDQSGVPIHMITIGREIIKAEEFTLYSGLITALFTFSESIAGTPEIIDLGDKYMTMYLLNVEKMQIFVVAIADKTDSREAIERTIKKIGEKLTPILSQLVLTSGLVTLNKESMEKLNEVLVKIVKSARRKFYSYRSGGLKTITFSTSISTILSIFISILEALVIFSVASMEGSFLGAIIYAWILSLLTGIIAGYLAGKPKEGAISGYLAIALCYLAMGLTNITFLFFSFY